MFINYNRCYIKRNIQERYVFLQVTNYTDIEIYFILQFTSQERGVITKYSDKFRRNQSKKLYWKVGSMEPAFNVVNTTNESVICNHQLDPNVRSYFNVVQTPTGLQCVQSKC